jgi:hypothetical protein
MKIDTPVALGLLVAVVAAGLSCTGRDESPVLPQSPSSVSTPTVSAPVASKAVKTARTDASPAASPAASPEPWTPPGTFACPLGKGSPTSSCSRPGTAPVFLGKVDAAIDELIQKKPELFDLTRKVGENGYLVLDPEKFYLGVAEVLQTKGLCAGWDLKELQVKDGNGFSEQYDLLLSNDHIRRGEGSFRNTCTPANFPLDASERISYVRVGFYSIACEDGRDAPGNVWGRLPVECTGLVTATPKDADGKDVDRRVHGPYVTWELEQSGEWVFMEDYEGVAFNKQLRGIDPGTFRLCATVQGHKGCLDGTVIPKE